MGSKKPKKLEEARQNFANVLLEETDRGCVLVLHGFIDGELEKIIRGRLQGHENNPEFNTKKQLDWLLTDGQRPPMQSFYVKLVFVRVLQLIDAQSFVALTKLNELRVHFAHYPGFVTLTDSRVNVIEQAMNPNSLFSIRELKANKFFDHLEDRHSAARLRFIYIAWELLGVMQFAMGTVARLGRLEGSYLSSRCPAAEN